MRTEQHRWAQRGVLGAMCVLVIGVYSYTARSGVMELSTPNAADAYYNSLVQGFRAGQLSLNKEVPHEFTQLADPYDPGATAVYWAPPYRMLDLSYYKGRLYLYFGITPALLLFWPYAALTGHYLFHRQAVVIFCAIGFLVSVGLLRALWRRYFVEVNVGVVAACVLALGLATGVSVLLSRSDVYEVPISCGYMLTMLTLGAIWRALHEPERRGRWLAAASLVYGLAVGARPSLLFGAIILLVPVAQARRERRRVWYLLVAAVIPIAVVGLGLMFYNALRFDSPFEFGIRYQLAGIRQVTREFFSPQCLWCNFRMYFLEPARWSDRFPFVRDIATPSLPSGYGRVEHPFGVLTSIPLVWLALAVPLALRGRSAEAHFILRAFLTGVALLFGICALTNCLFCAANFRYEVEFLPALVLLAAVGILGLERTQAPTSEPGLSNRPVRRRAVRWGWVLLLGYSVAVNLLVVVEHYAETDFGMGNILFQAGKIQEAVGRYEQALQLKPDYANAENNLGLAWWQLGKREEAVRHWKEAVRIKPDFAEVHSNLGLVLSQLGETREAMQHFEEALRLKPDYPDAHNNLGLTLWQAGRSEDAIWQWREALRLKPDYAEAHYNLGDALFQAGKIPEAIEHWERGLQIKPNSASVHYNLGVALEQAGRVPEAIGHYEQAIRTKPDYPEAQAALARLQATR